MRKRVPIFFVILTLYLLHCSPNAQFISRHYSRPHTLAILPTINHTSDVNGAIVFRNLLYVYLAQKNYSSLLSNTVVDSLLNQAGITAGGQLKTISIKELFQMLQVDGLLFVELQECNYLTIGLLERRTVRAHLWLILPPERLVWEDTREVDHLQTEVLDTLDDPEKLLKKSVSQLGEQLAIKGLKMWLLEHELKPEMIEVIHQLLRRLP